MLTNDMEYEKALRIYLENTFLKSRPPQDEESIDLNAIKPLTNYIKSLSEKPEDFLFTTPIYGWWDLTSACNFRCIHCLYNDREYSDKNDLTTEEALNLANELINDFGISSINLSGGEIFLRKDTMQIIRTFKENNVAVRLATNASLINDEIISELSELLNPYVDMMQISLDGATEATFAKIRKTDSFGKIIENIKKLTNAGISVNVSFVVNNINYHEIEDLYKLCCDLGVKTLVLSRLLCFNDSHKALEIPARELVVLASKIAQIDTTNSKTEIVSGLFTPLEIFNLPMVSKILEEDDFKPIFKKVLRPQARECNFHDRISIRSDGRVYMCMNAEACPESLMGNYRENSLLEIWENRCKNIFFEHRTLEKTGCKDCKYNVFCNSGCKVKAYKNFGTINHSEIKCKFAKI